MGDVRMIINLATSVTRDYLVHGEEWLVLPGLLHSHPGCLSGRLQ